MAGREDACFRLVHTDLSLAVRDERDRFEVRPWSGGLPHWLAELLRKKADATKLENMSVGRGDSPGIQWAVERQSKVYPAVQPADAPMVLPAVGMSLQLSAIIASAVVGEVLTK